MMIEGFRKVNKQTNRVNSLYQGGTVPRSTVSEVNICSLADIPVHRVYIRRPAAYKQTLGR